MADKIRARRKLGLISFFMMEKSTVNVRRRFSAKARVTFETSSVLNYFFLSGVDEDVSNWDGTIDRWYMLDELKEGYVTRK